MKCTLRQQQLLDIIKEKQYVRVEELSHLTYTSPSSIRRDLTRLQNAGLVRRMYGGVTLPEPISGVAGFYSRYNANVREKRAAAGRAATLLQDGMTLFLDGSSTVAYLLPHIAARTDITVYTSNLQTALDGLQQGIRMVCLGGEPIADPADGLRPADLPGQSTNGWPIYAFFRQNAWMKTASSLTQRRSRII